MKKKVQHLLQRLLGFERYLFWFAAFKIYTFKGDRNEKDFFHFLKLLNPSDTVLDIGANIGITSVWLSRTLPSGHIHSFEPVPPNIRTFEKIIKRFKCKNVSLHKLALGDHSGEVQLVMPEVEQVQMQGLSHVVHESMEAFNEGKHFSATIEKLDSLDFLTGKTIHAIKLDVENFEAFVLEGGRTMIEKQRPVIYTELWENENRDRCFEFIRKLNYRIQCLELGVLIDFEASKHQTQNFFFMP